jgi:hypothetical protein
MELTVALQSLEPLPLGQRLVQVQVPELVLVQVLPQLVQVYLL